ncbi:MAG: hypothetical protein COX57_01195 [Alphaproteobacteria bacterium CG_4_10_14_0_2_um_filter_63_37]|nr:MAG: hypothetical protein AUJ55_00180 [Proteobacteria bacterium CG1_02_64_396]PJA25863.1 MAG: hypothetical protein COX57_01195 [Alphaproteobacteria bacterium CG_4_10_14_0_2_um_filter_63_37]
MNIIQTGLATAGLVLAFTGGSAAADERWTDEWWVCSKPVTSVGMQFDCHQKGNEATQVEANMAAMAAKGLRTYSTTTEGDRLVVLFGRMLASSR